MEGKILEPIAIVGMAYRFPEGASSDDAFWKILMEGKCVSKEFPPDRMNINAFYNENSERLNRISTKKAHFLEEDISNFDAKFFGVPPHEASSMDPQHRILLETTYHALENGKRYQVSIELKIGINVDSWNPHGCR
jgi:acyl transferase domain-containing protein